jgi:hypothetical protein
MALKGEFKKIKEGEKEKEVFNVEFTNGTIEQLRDLKFFLVKQGLLSDDSDLDKVIEISIAFMERIKTNKNQPSK